MQNRLHLLFRIWKLYRLNLIYLFACLTFELKHLKQYIPVENLMKCVEFRLLKYGELMTDRNIESWWPTEG